MLSGTVFNKTLPQIRRGRLANARCAYFIEKKVEIAYSLSSQVLRFHLSILRKRKEEVGLLGTTHCSALSHFTEEPLSLGLYVPVGAGMSFLQYFPLF